MRKFTLAIVTLILSIGFKTNAQTVATFEDANFNLSSNDTFYINYSNSGNDVGFNDGLAHFPCVYDTAFGGYWNNGFAYSRAIDSTAGGLANQYAAKPGLGYDTSHVYAVAYGAQNAINLIGAAKGATVLGFFITNSSYAYYSMLNGDAFAKKFGGASGNDSDWFKLTIKGMLNGQVTADSVEFYLADYRSRDSAGKYIINSWNWVNLVSLGHVDSLLFTLNSTDTAGGFGMNTPAYFCIDDFTTDETAQYITQVAAKTGVKVFPNPAYDVLNVESLDNSVQQVTIIDASGRIVGAYPVNSPKLEINTSSLAPGSYFLQISGNGHTGMSRFVKQ